MTMLTIIFRGIWGILTLPPSSKCATKACLGLALILTGCSFNIGGDTGTKSYFVLEDLQETEREQPSLVLPLTIVVQDSAASRFINSQRIIFGAAPQSRGYYQFALWVEPPAKRFSFLLRRRLEQERVFSGVTSRSVAPLGDVQLNTEIIEFYHDITKRPGVATILVNAELIDLTEYRIIGAQTFEATVEVGRYNVDGAVKAFSKATAELLNDLIDWSYLQLKDR